MSHSKKPSYDELEFQLAEMWEAYKAKKGEVEVLEDELLKVQQTFAIIERALKDHLKEGLEDK